MTAGMAMRELSKEEYYAQMDKVKQRMTKAFIQVEEYLKGHGCHLEGAFQIVDNDTNIYMKLRRAQPSDK